LRLQNFTSSTDVYNVAIGRAAGENVTTGVNNTIIGGLAGDAITTGTANTLLGQAAGGAINTGANNTCIGQGTGDAMTTGSSNTFIGVNAGGGGTVTGNSNCAMGNSAGNDLTSGGNNLLLGNDAGRTGSPAGSIATGSNFIVLGDENIQHFHSQVSLSVASDQRDKTDFSDLDVGLDFVNALKPYTYKWDKRSKYGDKTADDYDLNAQTPDGTHKEDWLDVGFKAQEVEALEKSAGYKVEDKTNLTISLTEDGKQYGMRYEKFVPILVKALQELSAKNDALEARIKTLEG